MSQQASDTHINHGQERRNCKERGRVETKREQHKYYYLPLLPTYLPIWHFKLFFLLLQTYLATNLYFCILFTLSSSFSASFSSPAVCLA